MNTYNPFHCQFLQAKPALFLAEQSPVNVVYGMASGKLEKRDYQAFVPKLEAVMAEDKPMRLLMELNDFHGWTLGALVQECKLIIKHYNDHLERVAVVGDRWWEKTAVSVARLFTKIQVRYYPSQQRDLAEAWILKK